MFVVAHRVMVMMMSKWIFENRPVPQYTPVGTGSTVRHPTPLGTTTVPYPPHTSALGVPGERISADAQLGGGARGDTPSRGQITPSPGRGRIRANGGVHSIFGGLSHPGGRPHTNFKTTSHYSQCKNIHANFKI